MPPPEHVNLQRCVAPIVEPDRGRGTGEVSRGTGRGGGDGVRDSEAAQGTWMPGWRTGIQTRTVDMHVRRLRAKLGPCSDWLETVRGFGYRFRVPEEPEV